MAADPELRPVAALRHPLWLAGLLVLALNDHLLKGSGLLPSVLTGKLSDVAGLLIAPTLLATLLRVRRPSTLLACHLAVGLVFAAIQLSATAAVAWSGVMAALGFPWVITRDPTDLLALPALALSWVGLRPAIDRTRPRTRRPARLHLEAALAGVGLFFCAATSAPPEPIAYEPWFTDVYLHNDTDAPLAFTIRQLDDTLLIDCPTLLGAPGSLRERHFLHAEAWALSEQLNAPAQSVQIVLAQRPCRAVLVTGEGIPSALLTWSASALPPTTVNGSTIDENHGQGAVLVRQDDDGEVEYEAVGPVTITPLLREEPPPDPACPAQDDAARLDWSAPVPEGPNLLEEVEAGVDGCFALRVAGVRWYLCAPAAVFPFQAGDWVDVRPMTVAYGEALRIARLADGGGAPSDPPQVLLLSRGTDLPDLTGIGGGVLPRGACPPAPDEPCGTVAQPLDVRFVHADGAVLLSPGAPAVTVPNGAEGQWTLALVHAQARAVVDPECAEGPTAVGNNLEVAALFTTP